MPNWCENKLVVRGEEKDMTKFLKILGENATLSDTKRLQDILNAFHPIPEEEQENCRQWNIDNWGTKWDVECSEDAFIEDDHVELLFDSAWGPPVAWLKKVAKDYPKLKFSLKYDEPGMCFMGCAKGSKGVIENESIEYWEQ